jgi:hypothetical protein
MIPVHGIGGPLRVELLVELVGAMDAAGIEPHHSDVYVVAVSASGWAELNQDWAQDPLRGTRIEVAGQRDFQFWPELPLPCRRALLVVAMQATVHAPGVLAVVYGRDPVAIGVSRRHDDNQRAEDASFVEWVRSVWDNEV